MCDALQFMWSIRRNLRPRLAGACEQQEVAAVMWRRGRRREGTAACFCGTANEARGRGSRHSQSRVGHTFVTPRRRLSSCSHSLLPGQQLVSCVPWHPFHVPKPSHSHNTPRPPTRMHHTGAPARPKRSATVDAFPQPVRTGTQAPSRLRGSRLGGESGAGRATVLSEFAPTLYCAPHIALPRATGSSPSSLLCSQSRFFLFF